MAADADAERPRRAPAPATSTVEKEAEFLWELSKYVLLLATLAATVTYTARLDPPGGFWTDDNRAHLAGDPVLQETYHRRYKAFFYCKATAFVASLVIVNLLLVRFLYRRRTVSRHGFRSSALWVCVGATMVGLIGAFAAGSCRSFKTSIYVIALVGAVLLYIVIQATVFFCEPVKNWLRHAGQTLQKCLKLDELEQRNQQQITLSNQGNGDAYLLLKKSRMYLLLLGILVASVTYQAGLNPPGGFWQSNGTDGYRHYLTGDPVLNITYHRRYMVFFYSNATAFIASLVILILLLSNMISPAGDQVLRAAGRHDSELVWPDRSLRRWELKAGVQIRVAMILNLFGLIGAYAAGSCRQASKSVYVSVLVLPVFLYVGIHVLVFMLEVSPTWATWRGRVREKLKQCVPEWLKSLLELEEHVEEEEEEWKLEKRRKLLLLVAILAASLTYEAGMNPPGGFWQEKKSGHVGDPVLNNDNYRHRYLAFFFCNTTAFVASLAIIMLLVNRKLSARGIRSYALRVCVLVLVGLMGAFAAGSCRKVKTSIYVFVLVLAVLLCIAFQVALIVSDSLRRLINSLLSKLGAPLEEEAGERLPHTAADGEPRDLWDEKLPKYLLLLAALAAAITYQAAMSPPGGLWDDGQTEHTVGDLVLPINYPRRYKVFFYCNATSFMASLVIMVLLLIKRVSNTQPALLALHAAMILDLFGLMGAYAAGSCRRVTTSAYILALLVGVSAYIVVLVVVSIGVARWMKKVMERWGRSSHTASPLKICRAWASPSPR
uniref:PGG domain-containing protein n=1 Tax=Oryza punctata TaxID=4537 RepID=A0A0E0MJI8_ORYPU